MIEIERFPDWRARLLEYLIEVSRIPFEDGVHDCALFLAGGVNAMTGVDFAAPYRGRYTTLRGGIRILRKAGFRDHVALAEASLPRKPVALANEGDGACVDTPDGPALGIVQGSQIYFLSPAGLGFLPLTSAHTVWEV
jgi:hypothetical protein